MTKWTLVDGTVATRGNTRTNGDSTLKSTIRDAFPLRELRASQQTGDVHDRSCLEISEADGVDSGAFCNWGFTHLQFAEKPEAPEAERHLGSRWCSRARLSPKLTLTHSTYSRECFRNARVSIVTAADSILGSGVCRESTIGRAQVVIEASDVG
ncbi:hypothetical protein HZH68_006871 [Vespula germanica]|uniref:Uncharacterized protein n=1 Tax=Vespula germanica TaxID=30212 RepID=A0A834K8B7_VESGE|nr:hypothetical protein HZH68_006871 [Vespula germanica]